MQRERHWIPDRVGDDRGGRSGMTEGGEGLAGLRPRTTRVGCGGSGPGRSCALRRHEGAAWDGGGTKGKGKGNDAGSFT